MACALWSSEVYEQEDGSLHQVQRAISRGRQLACTWCGELGATLGCCAGRACSAVFHLKCAVYAHVEFRSDKTVFCLKHRTCSSQARAAAKARLMSPDTDRLTAQAVAVAASSGVAIVLGTKHKNLHIAPGSFAMAAAVGHAHGGGPSTAPPLSPVPPPRPYSSHLRTCASAPSVSGALGV